MISWSIESFDTLPSTMDVVRERGERNAPEGLVIVTKEQVAGIGRRGNVWIGPPGNLYFSLLIKDIDLKNVGQYSFIAAVSLADTAKNLLMPDFTYTHKWPNDGLINDRKFAGILLQTGKTNKGDDFLNMGVGINIVSAPEDKMAFNVAAAEPQTAASFLKLYLHNLDRNIDMYRKQGFSDIRDKWLENAKGLHLPMEARLPNETLSGIFDGLDESGALLLGLDNGGQKVIHSGEVFFGNEI